MNVFLLQGCSHRQRSAGPIAQYRPHYLQRSCPTPYFHLNRSSRAKNRHYQHRTNTCILQGYNRRQKSAGQSVHRRLHPLQRSCPTPHFHLNRSSRAKNHIHQHRTSMWLLQGCNRRQKFAGQSIQNHRYSHQKSCPTPCFHLNRSSRAKNHVHHSPCILQGYNRRQKSAGQALHHQRHFLQRSCPTPYFPLDRSSRAKNRHQYHHRNRMNVSSLLGCSRRRRFDEQTVQNRSRFLQRSCSTAHFPMNLSSQAKNRFHQHRMNVSSLLECSHRPRSVGHSMHHRVYFLQRSCSMFLQEPFQHIPRS